jgi:hypothetical protein
MGFGPTAAEDGGGAYAPGYGPGGRTAAEAAAAGGGDGAALAQRGDQRDPRPQRDYYGYPYLSPYPYPWYMGGGYRGYHAPLPGAGATGREVEFLLDRLHARYPQYVSQDMVAGWRGRAAEATGAPPPRVGSLAQDPGFARSMPQPPSSSSGGRSSGGSFGGGSSFGGGGRGGSW